MEKRHRNSSTPGSAALINWLELIQRHPSLRQRISARTSHVAVRKPEPPPFFFFPFTTEFAARRLKSDGGFVSCRTPSEAQRNFHL